MLTPDQMRWINATLANDEASDDTELVAYFTENGIESDLAGRLVRRRMKCLMGLEVTLADLEGGQCVYCTTPVDPNVLVCPRCR